jgi:cytochrome oxidase Cu insertion factor (SCO1/SenC/PrrC family)
MKTHVGVVILCFFTFLVLVEGQERPSIAGSDTHFSGLEVGQKAPGFTVQDQFGHQQSNETLKGSNGTVLLFFRSADW